MEIQIGVTAGKLTVLSGPTTSAYGTSWKCHCSKCNTDSDVSESILKGRKTYPCCSERGSGPSARRKDYTGQKFNLLTAIRFVGHTTSGNSKWEFKCDCDPEKIVVYAARQVVRGDITSCGCRKSELLSKANILPNDRSIKNAAYGKHLDGAKKRNIVSYLTQADYDAIIMRPCTYCGKFSQRKNYIMGYSAPLNSVDRKNNEPYYKLENSVPACFVCQKAKGKMSYQEFLDHVKAIHQFQTERKE